MKKIITTILICVYVGNFVKAQSSTTHQVLLLGNLVDVSNSTQFLADIKRRLQQQESAFTVVLIGDLTGSIMEEPTTAKSLLLIYKIMDLVNHYPMGSLVIMSGDRDWNYSGKGGEKNVRMLEDSIKGYYKKHKYSNIKWVTKNQCPGPKVIKLNEHLILVAINTQWWNHPFDKVIISDGKCSNITPHDFKEELEDVVSENQDKNILFVGHHPFYSIGNYGGKFSFADHLKPFPIIGSFRTAYHRNIGNQIDIGNENLKAFRKELIKIFSLNDNLIFASAHERNNYILKGSKNYIINSGALSKGKFIGKDKNLIFKSEEGGWIELVYDLSGAVKAQFISSKSNNIATLDIDLFQSACDKKETNKKIPVNNSFIPCHYTETTADKIKSKDTGMVSKQGGIQYKKSKWFMLWFGKHYRSSWTTPVSIPYLNLDTTKNGLEVIKKGGGRQTTSLRIKAKDGTLYTFRSVDKDPSKALNFKLRNTIATTVIRDQTSTQHPFGALAVAPLLDKLDILHASPKLYVLPNDIKLGAFQKDYSHLFGMLEEFPGKPNNAGIRFENADKIIKSNQLFRSLYKSSANRVNQKEFIRARIFDMLIGDWSKHEDNWKWAGFSQEKGMIYRPIPRDRDHAFSKQDGIIPWLADRDWGIKNIEHFGYKIDDFKSLMMQARTLDRPLASGAILEDWLTEALYIQEAISNEDIDAAIQNMPAEVYEIDGKLIADKLKKRLASLQQSAETYYRLLAKEVDVIASNKAEYFLITRFSDGKVSVKIYDMIDENKGNDLRFSRIFIPEETKEIRVYALGGNDVFDIQGAFSSKIKIRLFGGSDKDLFKEDINEKSDKTLFYDKGMNTTFNIAKGAKVINHWNKRIYEYDRLSFNYNSHMPIISFGYNQYNGFSFGGGVTFTSQAFGKEDYSSKHHFFGGFSTEGNILLNYEAKFHQVFKKWDFLLKAEIQSPSFHNNFYGLGNNTELLDDLEDINFYVTKIKTYHLDIGIGQTFWKKSSLDFRLGIEQVESLALDNELLNKGSLVGASNTLTILPLETNLDINFLDKNGLPYFGTRLQLQYTNGSILGGAEDISNYGVLRSSVQYYVSNHHHNPFTLGFRIGGAIGHGAPPYYKLPTLGNSTGLRGYTGNRFSGESSFFINAEIRKQLFHHYTKIVPVKLGVKMFFDTGRVFYNDEKSKTWHYGYGAGIYLIPLDESLTVSLSLAFSEENSFYPVFGIAKPLK